MRPERLQAVSFPQYSNTIRHANTNNYKDVSQNTHISLSDIPCYAIKANFAPSFGKYRKIKDVELTDRNTGENINAIMKRDRISDSFDFFSIYVKGKQAGFMEIGYDEPVPEGDFVLTENDNTIPEVKRIYSILGDDYKGIGTELIKQAVEESRARGKNGSLWLTAETGFASGLTKHRRNESPIPFYYGMGFESPENKTDTYIKKCISNSRYNKLPKSALLVLSSQEADKRY